MDYTDYEVSDKDQLEDKVMKAANQYFGEEILPYFGIKQKVRRVAPTEIVYLRAKRLHEDFVFEMEDGSLTHFEFESDAISLKDLKRFREYEAITSRQCNTAVITYVICSAEEKYLKSEFSEGINTYRVKVIRLKNYKADQIFHDMGLKISKGQTLEKQELVVLVLTPLMDGTTTIKDRILQTLACIRYSEETLSKEELEKILAMIYALANKFLKEEELREVKGVLGMTKLGQMIWDDGLEQGTREAIVKMLKKLTPKEVVELGFERDLVDDVSKTMEENV